MRPPLRGTRTVYPSIPCVPGSSPVINVARLVAVVDGNDVRSAPACVREEIVGMRSL